MVANRFTAFLVWILSVLIRTNLLNRNIIIYLGNGDSIGQMRGSLVALLKMRRLF